MSKQSQAKEAQNYRKKPMCCAHCEHFSSEIKTRTPAWARIGYTIAEEKNLRCNLGEFSVQKTASCDKFAPKAADPQ